MRWPILGLAASLVLGLGCGLALAAGLARGEAQQEVIPLAGEPAYPSVQRIRVLPDTDDPAFAAPFRTHTEYLGRGTLRLRLPVPDGMEQVPFGSSLPQARWILPGDPSGAYVFRVERMEETQSIASMPGQRRYALNRDPSIARLEVLSQTSDGLTFTFVQQRYARASVVRWVSLDDDDTPEIEIAVTGRLIDRPGMEDWAEHLADRIRAAPTHPDRRRP